MVKSEDAFRTIREVSDFLNTPAHVLRFWETKFSQIKPMKRAGGRRYYRRSDISLIAGIKKLLHSDGVTIRGVQKILREQGVKHVALHSEANQTDNPPGIKSMPSEAVAVSGEADKSPNAANLANTRAELAAATDAVLNQASRNNTPEKPSTKAKKTTDIGAQISLFDDLPQSESPSAKLGHNDGTFPERGLDGPSQLVESDRTDRSTDGDIVPEIAAQLAKHTATAQNDAQPDSVGHVTTKPEAGGDITTATAISGPLYYLSEVDDLRPLQQEQLPKLRDMLSEIFHSEE